MPGAIVTAGKPLPLGATGALSTGLPPAMD